MPVTLLATSLERKGLPDVTSATQLGQYLAHGIFSAGEFMTYARWLGSTGNLAAVNDLIIFQQDSCLYRTNCTFVPPLNVLVTLKVATPDWHVIFPTSPTIYTLQFNRAEVVQESLDITTTFGGTHVSTWPAQAWIKMYVDETVPGLTLKSDRLKGNQQHGLLANHNVHQYLKMSGAFDSDRPFWKDRNTKMDEFLESQRERKHICTLTNEERTNFTWNANLNTTFNPSQHSADRLPDEANGWTVFRNWKLLDGEDLIVVGENGIQELEIQEPGIYELHFNVFFYARSFSYDSSDFSGTFATREELDVAISEYLSSDSIESGNAYAYYGAIQNWEFSSAITSFDNLFENYTTLSNDALTLITANWTVSNILSFTDMFKGTGTWPINIVLAINSAWGTAAPNIWSQTTAQLKTAPFETRAQLMVAISGYPTSSDVYGTLDTWLFDSGLTSFESIFSNQDISNWPYYSSISLTDYWIQGDRNDLVSSIDIGNSFEATSNLVVVAFCRLPLIRYGELNDSIRVRLWDDETQTVLHERLVGPGAYLSGNMRCETLETPIALVQGKRYTISQVCTDGMADLWVYNYQSTGASTINSLIGTAASAWFHDGIGWPDSPWATSWPSVGLLAVTPAEEGTLTLGNGSAMNNWDVQYVTDMKSMFEGANGLNQHDISSWDVSNVTDMSSMFKDCVNFDQNISSWNVSKVTNMSSMFEGCTDIPDGLRQNIQNWQTLATSTVENVVNFANMFLNSGNWPVDTVVAINAAWGTANQTYWSQTTAQLLMAAPFPNLTKLELGVAGSTYASVIVDLDRPGSVSFHLESTDDADYVREDFVATITQEYLDYEYWTGFTHIFTGLVGSKSYKCICDTVLDVYGNEEPNGTEFQFTTDSPISVSATLTAPAVPQGRTALVAEVNANKQSSWVLVLSSAGGESYTQNLFNANAATRTFENLTPGTLYTLNVTAREAGQTEEATAVVSASTRPSQLEIIASLSTPAENSGTSLVANFAVSRSASVRLTLTADGETYDQETQEGTQSFVFQGLTPSTPYTLTAVATADLDGSEASASDTRSTLASSYTPILISVDIVSSVATTRPPVSGSAPTADGHIVPLEGEYGAWNAILTTGGQELYEKNNLLNDSQEETSIGVVVNSNSAQHYTYGFYDGGTKTNVGEDVIGLATLQNTGSLLECYFTGLDDGKRYTVRMFGQHVNQSGVGSVNFAKFGVNGDKKDTGPTTATCTWYAVAPSGGRIDFTLEYIDPENSNEYASLGGFQLLEEIN